MSGLRMTPSSPILIPACLSHWVIWPWRPAITMWMPRRLSSLCSSPTMLITLMS